MNVDSCRGGRPYLFIGNVVAGAALPPGVAQQGGESAQAKVIVVLFGQLLHGQGVEGEHLLRQNLQGKDRNGWMSGGGESGYGPL